jgi:hypothetical protein
MTEYAAIFEQHLKKIIDLRAEQRRINTDMEKATEMLKASFANMSNEERMKFVDTFDAALEQMAKREVGLTEAIRTVLQSNPKGWFNALKVRAGLKDSGFDFTGYTSDPLASIHAVLKRFKRTEVKVRKDGAGLKEYRWIGPDNRPVAFKVTTTIIDQK